ncbi:Gfo/Idh/MocA family oxidoreductase, partial [Candidatus Gottesmanbacteria bacterium]|nr:Gfo/Idh/MocA family oxidoreductase [Candidatus Gottesmanbacteria bacterium]
ALVSLAKKKRKILMVDHTFVYTPAVREIALLIRSNKLGDIICVDTSRTNLGLFQRDTNVLYDLATHDFSILDYLLEGTLPVSVSATGTYGHNLVDQEAVADVVAHYPHGLYVHCHVSWLSPIKVRLMQIVGTRTMLSYEDTQATEKIKLYNRGITLSPDQDDLDQRRIGYRLGSMVAPYIPVEEGLTNVVGDFISSIRSGRPPRTDGASGLRIVTIVEAATRSLRHGGAVISLDDPQ